MCPLRRNLIASFLLLPGLACAEGHIDLSLTRATPEDAGASVILRLTNTGDTPVSIMKWDTPFPASGGRLPGSIFKVTDAAGNEVAYRGSWVYVGRLGMDSFRSVSPGEVLTKEVDLALEYRFEANKAYKIRYEIDLTREPDAVTVSAAERAGFAKSAQDRAVSNEVTVFFNDAVAVKKASLPEDELKCSLPQQAAIVSARLEATRRVFAAEQFMRDRYVPYIEANRLRYRFKSHPRYVRWFGVHDDGEPEFGSDGWGLNDNARVYETVIATGKRVGSGAPNVYCGCPGFEPNVAAHVESESTYNMYFCSKFFELPLFDAYASQAGAVAHEYTHYNAFYPGTADRLYGYPAVEKLAKEKRSEAVRNADNFEFFFTDTTPYQE
jgi:hypothetical protein